MVGVPECWNCKDEDYYSSARRLYCQKCGANLWWEYGDQINKFRPKPGKKSK